MNLSDELFGANFADSVIKRLGLERLKRNAQICIENSEKNAREALQGLIRSNQDTLKSIEKKAVDSARDNSGQMFRQISTELLIINFQSKFKIQAQASLVEIGRADQGILIIDQQQLAVSKRRRPRFPPGWNKAKSSFLIPLLLNSVTASASPIARTAVVDAVGTRLIGHASSFTETGSV